MPFVYVIQGFDQGVREDIEGGVFRIGRDSSNQLQLRDSEVSRHHAEIRLADGDATVHDLGSSNGTFVNGVECKEKVLASGDRIQFGSTHLIFTSRAEVRTNSEISSDVSFQGSDEQVSQIIKSVTPDLSVNISSQNFEANPSSDDVKKHLQVMYHTTMAVSQTLDIGELLERLMDLIFEWVAADRGCFILFDEKTNSMLPMVSRYREGINEQDGIIISQRIVDYVMERCEGVLTTDARDDARWEAAGSIVCNNIKEAICVPLAGRYGMVGVIYIDTSRIGDAEIIEQDFTRFNDEHLKMMVAIGHQAALAIEDTRFYSSMVQAERLAAMGQTITAISHHIKNIIQGVNGGSYLVDEGQKSRDWKTLEKGWQIVQRNQQRISDLVLDMLTFSKNRRPEVSSSNLNNVTEDVVDILRRRAESEGSQLYYEGLAGIHQYMFDPDGIHRVLLNIASNALDAVKELKNGKVTVHVDHDMKERMLQVSISDNGQGILPELQEKVFHAFVSGKGATGTGLGLAVSQKIIREHNGTIEIESDGEKGTCFIIRWPSVSPTERMERLRDSSIAEQNKIQ